MLSKEVCKKCIKKYGGYWESSDEESWMIGGSVYCPHQFREKYSNIKSGICIITNPPSKGCPFKLEHIVIGG